MRTTHPLRHLAFAAALFAAVTGLLVSTSRPAWTDDVELLRFDTGNPYLFIILDTSGSMNLPLATNVASLSGDADEEGSRLYEAKRALYEVFKDVDDVHFGFATYNQDQARVVSKHWLYVPSSIGDTSGWPVTGYPAATDVMTFGADLGSATAGSCGSPLKLSTQRAAINRFSKLGKDFNATTTIWVEDTGNKIFRLTVTKLAGWSPGVVQPDKGITIQIAAQEFKKTGCTAEGAEKRLEVALAPGTPFEFLMYDGVVSSEGSVGFWNHQDAFALSTFGADRPFTGLGWEGNYDSTFDPLPGNDPFETGITNDDPFCLNDASNNKKCLNLKFPTTRHPQFPSGTPYHPEVDSGDVLTLDWRITDGNKNEMLQRLAPNLRSDGLSATPDYGIASYFVDVADFPNGGSGVNSSLSLRISDEKPLIAVGNSPLGRAINDFRCWWNGDKDEKCKSARAYKNGFESLALQYDPEWGCRRPYLLLISDGEDNSTAESPNADVANLNSKAGIKTWAVNLGDPSACDPPNKLHSITKQGEGTCVKASNRATLEAELRKLLGQIREETRAFASAAVPSVQATVEDKIFLTNFTPLENASVWDGHVHSFLKPLPQTADGRPDTAVNCSTKDIFNQSRCHLWDAGVALLDQAPGPPSSRPTTDAARETANLKVGPGREERWVLYGMQLDYPDGTWWNRNRLFTQVDDAADAIREDFRKGLGTGVASDADANKVVVDTLWQKTGKIGEAPDETIITYVLGDIFHSNPLVAGSPINTRYFAENAGTDGKTCAEGDRGYRCFFNKHEKRRKMLLVGSNDGMVHAFDAGQWDEDKIVPVSPTRTDNVPGFDNGDGREIFAYIPRMALPIVREHALDTDDRNWAVDGTLSVADVFIDPAHVGTPTAAEREWRTIMLGGLREGGAGYFALDITQPDKVEGSDNLPVPDDRAPSCLKTIDDDVLDKQDDCGPVPFPSVLWEFQDAALDVTGRVARDGDDKPILLDEDGAVNGTEDIDLGEAWSVPNIGRIKLCEGTTCTPGTAEIKDKFVAVFGGGMDPDKSDLRGNYLYMMDIETGKVIYKRRLEGSAPSEPAAVDTDQDGYLDRIYIGTTKGFLYRVDLGLDSSKKIPRLAQVPVTGNDGKTYTAHRVAELDSAGNPQWAPQQIFSTGGRPIYYRPSVIFVAKLGRYALSFGTGDREDLWSKSINVEGRFYVFVDDSDLVGTLPMTEATLQPIAVADADVSDDFLLGRTTPGTRGWFLRLNVDERVITDAFALSGVTVFSSYQPDTCIGTLDPDTNVCTPPANNAPKLCAKTGRSRIFVVNTTNANSFIVNADSQRSKFFLVSNFVTNPYVEQGPTRNPGAETGSGTSDADELTAGLVQIMNELKKLFPKNCKFTNYRLDIKTIAADTDVHFIAPVPICIIEKNWKEF